MVIIVRTVCFLLGFFLYGYGWLLSNRQYGSTESLVVLLMAVCLILCGVLYNPQIFQMSQAQIREDIQNKIRNQH